MMGIKQDMYKEAVEGRVAKDVEPGRRGLTLIFMQVSGGLRWSSGLALVGQAMTLLGRAGFCDVVTT